MVLLAFDSGARRGEYLAARWRDLDMDNRTLTICRSVDETEAHGVVIKDALENDRSQRTVRLSARTVDVPRDLWRERAEIMLQLGARLTDDMPVFPLDVNAPRGPLRPREVTKAFSRIVKRAGYEGFRLHDLRHCRASYMLANGRPIIEVSRYLGHASPQITLSVYSHCIPRETGAAGLLDQLAPIQAAE